MASVEPPLVTVGDDLNTVAQFLAPGRDTYSAADVVALAAEPGRERGASSRRAGSGERIERNG